MRRFLVALALAGCKVVNSQYCENPAHATDEHCRGADGGGCASNADCTGAAAICGPGGACVECLAEADCAASANVCEPDTHTCGACTKNSDCASGLCVPDGGTCAAPDKIAWVAASDGAPGNSCTSKLDACTKLSKAIGIGRPYVHVALDGADAEMVSIVVGTRVAIVAEPGARMASDGSQQIGFKITSTLPIAIYNLEIDAGQVNTIGVDIGTNASVSLVGVTIAQFGQFGVRAAGSHLTMSRCTVIGNAAGGILVQATSTFDLVNNVIASNGSQNAGTGGIQLQHQTAVGDRIAFNTIADNHVATNNAVAGLDCGIGGFHATQNLIVRNTVGVMSNESNVKTTGMNCTYDDSLISPSADSAMFVHAGFPDYDYHLSPGSAAIDRTTMATQAPTVDVDLDGQVRPNGASRDVGADEYYTH